MNDRDLMLKQVRYFINQSQEGKLPIFVSFPSENPVVFLDSLVDMRAFLEHFKDVKKAQLISVLEGAVESGLLVGRHEEIPVKLRGKGANHKKSGIMIRGVTLLGQKFNIYGLKGV